MDGLAPPSSTAARGQSSPRFAPSNLVTLAPEAPQGESAMTGKFMSEERLRTITKRQERPAWGADYQAAIRATRAEAPRISRPTILHPRKIGRDMHLMSEPETAFALLALFNPAVFDIHEQHMISMLPALHPLAGHPKAESLRLADLPGSIAIAEAMGIIDRHPRIFIEDLEGGTWVPFPYIGDLLLFLCDQDGPYCVNWTVKNQAEEFRAKRLLPGMRRLKVRSDVDDDRHRLEAAHFAQAQIPTVQQSLPCICEELVRNLRNMHDWEARDYDVDDSTREAVIGAMRAIVGTSKIAFHRMRELGDVLGCSTETVRAITNSAIWRREIRVDLFRPIPVDRPLRAECVDPLVKYAHWFRR